MDKLDFTEGMKILSSCYHKEINNDDFIIWYEMLQDKDPEAFRKAIIEICKEKSYIPTIHDVLDKIESANNSFYLHILEQMKNDGYFKRGVKPLTPEHESKNYDKAIKWIESGIMPEFLKEDMQEYINKSSLKIKNSDTKLIE